MSTPARDPVTFDVRIGDAIPTMDEAMAFLSQAEGGGDVLFAGTTRRITGDRETVSLFYEAHVPLAEAECERLLAEAARQWPVLRAFIWHRLGNVPVSETSVLIGVATAHREEAFDACYWLIDTLKRRVPIWKRERFRDGATSWVPGSW